MRRRPTNSSAQRPDLPPDQLFLRIYSYILMGRIRNGTLYKNLWRAHSFLCSALPLHLSNTPPPSQLDQGVHQRSVQADLQASFGPSKSPESSPRLSHPLGFGRLAFRYSSRGKLSAPMAPWSMPHFSSGGGGEIDCSGFWKLIFACSPYFKYELHLSPMSKHQID
jgi:hypothetical protein